MHISPALIVEEDSALTEAMMVMLGAPGLCIPGLDDAIGGDEKHAAVPLQLPELLLLAELKAATRPLSAIIRDVAVQTEIDPRRLHELLSKLADRGLLINDKRGSDDRVDGHRIVALGNASDLDEATPYSTAVPRLFLLSRGKFEHVDCDGRTDVQLSAVELVAASEFRRPVTVGQAFAAHHLACGSQALDQAQFTELVHRLAAADLLQQSKPAGAGQIEQHISPRFPQSWKERHESTLDTERKRFQRLNDLMRQSAAECESAERQREEQTGRKRTRVVCVQENGTIFPLALGMIVGTAKSYQDGRLNDHYFFHEDWLIRPSKIRALVNRPGVFLFSNYNWSHLHNLKVSKKVKELSPWSVTIHGGPNTPKYEADSEAYLRANPDVDVIVRGEGEFAVCEILSALAGVVGVNRPDLSLLCDVKGISYIDGGRIVRTPDRDRLVHLDSIPSPMLTGLCDRYAGTTLAIIETNRGCPYSCTFCDWGSAIGSRIRKFSIERVFAELEWCAKNRIDGVNIADANFGIFDRDVEIAQKVAALKKEYGFPNAFSATYAKNTVKSTKRIIKILVDAGVISAGNIAAQSMDADTLKTIRRSNIKLDKYQELATEFRKAGLPLFMDLIFGLPGQTVSSFKNDLQECVSRNVFPRMYMAELLINSPMNEPSYREEQRIATQLSPDGSRNLVISTATFDRQDYEEMCGLRAMFIVCDSLGMLRQVAHYVRSETGTREIDFYSRLRRDVRDDPERWPILAFSLRALPGLLIPPVSWYLAVDEAGRYLREVLEIEDDTALATVLAVQNAVLPARDRTERGTLGLAHDYVAWHRAMTHAKESGHQTDWPTIIPKLRDFGPASFSSGDCDAIRRFRIGSVVDADLEGSRRRFRPETAPASDVSGHVEAGIDRLVRQTEGVVQASV
jgi:radical SAM superfamily enzyme YgiQ (UPF0313 family)